MVRKTVGVCAHIFSVMKIDGRKDGKKEILN